VPHCIIEHAASLSGDRVMLRVYDAVKASGLFDPDGRDIKVRNLAYSHYWVGGEKSDFIHVVLKILAGRSAAQKQQLSHMVLTELSTLNLNRCALSVEVIDIDRDSYAKVIG
jgi:5-carboxymethyl-2-hydroxymuconate isomerase